MKNNIIASAILLIALSSCNNFLEVTPETSLATVDFYKKQSDFDQAVAGIYAPLQAIYEIDWRLTELRSDNSFFTYDVGNRGTKPIEDFATFTVETNNATVQSSWRNNYLIIARANQVLITIDQVNFNQDAKNNLKGQALFLRALAYFNLVKNFGPVPLFSEPPTSYQGTFKPRSPIITIYEQVIADAKSAASLLPGRSTQAIVGRATAGSAYTMLADVYITLGRWAEAQTALLAVEKMGYGLLPDYSSIFKPTNKGNIEIIFEINYVEATSQPLFSSFLYSFIPELADPSVITGVRPASPNGNGGLNVPTPDLIAAYEKNIDKRYAATIGYYTGPSPLVGIPTYQDMPYTKKYQHPHAIPGQTNVNWPVYRYAEVLLMLAESLNEQSKPAEALIYLNQVRNRAGLTNTTTTSQTELRDFILKERRIELAFENKRWHDLVRTGKAVSVMNAFGANVKANPQNYYYAPGNTPVPNAFKVTSDYLIYPIPSTELVVNNNLVQNPGY